MVWFYRLDREEIVNTKTDIPQEQWEKKQVLPYRKEYGETPGLVIGETEVVETFYQLPVPVPTLDELKQLKLNEIKLECQNSIYSVYSVEKQLSAALDVYDTTKKSEIKTFVKSKVDLCNQLELDIQNATTVEELDLIVWGG